MHYRLPTNKEIVNVMVTDYLSHETPTASQCLNDFYLALNNASRIASLNYYDNREYIEYLEYFKKFIRVSNDNQNSLLRKAIDDYYSIKKLHQIL